MALIDNHEPLLYSSDNSRFLSLLSTKVVTFQGRILPQSEPYCRASFLIQITLPQEYPFKIPEFIFLDPIYHPNVDDSGRHCCDCAFQALEKYTPARDLANFIEDIIHNIDNPSSFHECRNLRVKEYHEDPTAFHHKALEHTREYGRTRY